MGLIDIAAVGFLLLANTGNCANEEVRKYLPEAEPVLFRNCAPLTLDFVCGAMRWPGWTTAGVYAVRLRWGCTNA